MGDVNVQTKFGSAKLARDVIGEFATSLDGFSMKKCAKVGMSGKPCEILNAVLFDGKVNSNEKKTLSSFGFSNDFIYNLAGNRGDRALRERVKWLRNHIDIKWYKVWSFIPAQDRRKYIQKLGEIGPDAKEAMPALEKLLNNCNVFAEQGYKYIDRTPLTREEILICYDAVEAVSKMGSVSINVLLKELNSVDPKIRTLAARGLLRRNDKTELSKSEMKKMIEILKNVFLDGSKDWKVRVVAAYALSSLGKTSVPHFVELMLNNKMSVKVRKFSTFILGEIKSENTIEYLRRVAQNDSDAAVQDAAMSSLSRMGRSALPALKTILTSDNADTRIKAISMVSNIGRESIPYLIKALDHDDASVRMVAARSLGELEAIEASSKLEEMSSGDKSKSCRDVATIALIAIKSKHKVK